jgi:hypothetical protein
MRIAVVPVFCDDGSCEFPPGSAFSFSVGTGGGLEPVLEPPGCYCADVAKKTAHVWRSCRVRIARPL